MLKTIIGEKVILRPITKEDTSLIVGWRNRESVRRNFVFQEQFTNEMHEAWFDSKVSTGEVVQYIIVEKANMRPVGSVYFRDMDNTNNSAEFGIFIGEDEARGKGIGTEVAKLFISFGFEQLNLHRIMLRVFSDNNQALNTYKKVGFSTEGVFCDMIKQNGIYRDMTFMAIINSNDT